MQKEKTYLEKIELALKKNLKRRKKFQNKLNKKVRKK